MMLEMMPIGGQSAREHMAGRVGCSLASLRRPERALFLDSITKNHITGPSYAWFDIADLRYFLGTACSTFTGVLKLDVSELQCYSLNKSESQMPDKRV